MLAMTGSTEGQAPGRSADFKSGALGGGPYTLQATSGAFNDQAASAARRPHSVLDLYYNIRNPDNGNSPADAKRQTPSGQMPSRNGYADSTYEATHPNFSYNINTN